MLSKRVYLNESSQQALIWQPDAALVTQVLTVSLYTLGPGTQGPTGSRGGTHSSLSQSLAHSLTAYSSGSGYTSLKGNTFYKS